MQRYLRLLVSLLAITLSLLTGAAYADGLQQMEFTVGGVTRTALIYVPTSAKTSGTPVVFVFHGHGGNSRQAARSFAMDRQWPEAISVYMQGLDTPGQLTDLEGTSPGWQRTSGDQGDRDLKFFDAVLARIKQDYNVDTKRIYCTGHSNGGGFTYLLWLKRGDVFAAVAPSSAAARYVNELSPKPAMILGGQTDALVKFTWQKFAMDAVRRINGCAATGETWGKQATLYPSKTGTPLVTVIYPGGHEFNSDSPALIAKFFKENPGH